VNEESVCYQLIYPGNFYQICCCYNEKEYHKCAVADIKFNEDKKFRCLTGNFDSGDGGSGIIIAKTKPESKKYEYCAIDYLIKPMKQGEDIKLQLQMTLSGRDKLPRISEEWAQMIPYVNISKNATVCQFTNAQCVSSTRTYDLSVTCTCASGDYCNTETYSTWLTTILLNDQSCPMPDTASILWISGNGNTCVYFYETITFKPLFNVIVGNNAHLINFQDIKNFVKTGINRVDVRLDLNSSSCDLKGNPLAPYASKTSLFSLVAVVCQGVSTRDCDLYKSNATSPDSRFYKSEQLCRSFTVNNISNMAEYMNATNTGGQQSAINSSRCYAEFVMNKTDHTYQLSAKSISIQDDKYNVCMQVKRGECIYLDGAGCEVCCQAAYTDILGKLKRCTEQALLTSDVTEIEQYLPSFSSCHMHRNSASKCVQLKNKVGCVLWKSVSDQEKAHYECIRQPTGHYLESTDLSANMYSLCRNSISAKVCFYATRYDLLDNQQQIVCCFNSEDPIKPRKDLYGRKVNEFMEN